MSATNKKLMTIAVVAALVSAGIVYASNRIPSVQRAIG